MKLRSVIPAMVFLLIARPDGRSQVKLRSTDRPVFMSAARLELLCEDWNSLNPGGKRPANDAVLNVSPKQIVGAEMCEAYILGVMDDRVENAFGAHYHPVPSEIDYLKPLIDAFMKHVKDHPEEEDFAASTIIRKVEALIVQAQSQKPKS